jgi:lysophospholipase L1-like esterase
MKNKIRLLFGTAALFLISVSSIVWYLNSGGCKGPECGLQDAMASVTYSVCVTGDSIAYGMGDTAGGWAERLEYYFLDRYPGSSVGNYSLPGATALGIKDLFDSGCGSQNAKITIVAVGINDSARAMHSDVFKNNLKSIYDKASKASEKVAFVGLTRVYEERINGLNYRNISIEAYDKELKDLTAELGADYIDLSESLEDGDFSEDGLHPNDFGHEKIFLKVKDYVENLPE